jgi:23S rRNA (guanosine2251-2'-O)-methyltransferase
LAGRRKTLEVIFSSGLDDAPILDDIIDLADENKVPVSELSRAKFDSTARTESSQGVMAFAQAVPETTLDELGRTNTMAPGEAPFLLTVDGVTDPGNLGALLRSAECAGVSGVLLPKHRAVHLSPTVTKSAAGAIEHLPMCLVGGLPAAITRLRELGVWVIGLDGAADQSLFDLNLAKEPVALVLGSEGKGLSRLVAQRCDSVVSIPLRGALGSLNVGAAGTLACYEVARRRV